LLPSPWVTALLLPDHRRPARPPARWSNPLYEERAGDWLHLRSTIAGFFPALAARPGEPDSTGALYSQVQRRVYLAISRR
jgi:hypothetical protein